MRYETDQLRVHTRALRRRSIGGRAALVLCLFAAAMLLSPNLARAGEVTWTLNGVTFQDGGTATGTFTYNAQTATVSNWNIFVSGGNTLTYSPFTYSPADSTFLFIVNSTFNFVGPVFPNISPNGEREFRLNPVSPLTDAGGSIGLNQGGVGSVECYNCFPDRLITSGTLSAPAAAPEPGSLLLLAMGLLCVTALLRKERWFVAGDSGFQQFERGL